MAKEERRGGFHEEKKEFKEELLRIDRVTRVTAGGRQLRFRASVIIGDNNGRIGFGIGKAGEVVIAIEKAVRDAKKNLVHLPITNGTIPYDVTAKYKAAAVYIHPADEGTGIIAGGAVRKVLAVSGIKDILAKQNGSSKNPINNARAVIKALGLLKAKPTSFSTKKSAPVDAPIVPEAVAVVPVVVAPVEAPKPAPAKKTAPVAKAPAKKPAAKKEKAAE